MAISRQQKEEQVSSLKASLEAANLTVLVDYQGLSVAEMQELRSLLAEQDSSLKIVKNNLIKLACEQIDALKGVDASLFAGPTALAFGQDEVAPAQVLAKFAKANPALEIKAAINQLGEVLDQSEVLRLAALPAKPQLQAQLVGTLAGSLSGLVRVLNGNISNFVQLTRAIRDQKA
jgi:large subunit ribosomal protein L10